MPRGARERSESGTYHIMFRGINRQKIFCDEEDCARFLQTLVRYKLACGFELFAYCLMPNHVHLLIREGSEPLATAFRRLGASYVYWYNLKYDRVGHLFQDRYKSEAIHDDDYLLTALRYIHNNPVKAGFCEAPADYPYSSYADYVDGGGLADTGFVLGMVGREEFIELHRRGEDDRGLDQLEYAAPRLSDRKAVAVMKRCTGCDAPAAYLNLEDEKQREGVRALAQRGASIRQIARLTGLSFSRARRMVKTRRTVRRDDSLEADRSGEEAVS